MKGGCLLVFTDTVPRLISAASDSDRVRTSHFAPPLYAGGSAIYSLSHQWPIDTLLMVRKRTPDAGASSSVLGYCAHTETTGESILSSSPPLWAVPDAHERQGQLCRVRTQDGSRAPYRGSG